MKCMECGAPIKDKKHLCNKCKKKSREASRKARKENTLGAWSKIILDEKHL